MGGAGNLMMGRAVVANAKDAFGPMPDTVPGELKPAGTSGPDAGSPAGRPLGAGTGESGAGESGAMESQAREGGPHGSER